MVNKQEKTCSRCGISKPFSAFGWRGSGREGDPKNRQSYCKVCMREYRKSHYRQQVHHIDDVKKKVERLKTLFGCEFCGFSDHRALIWDKEPDTSKSWEYVFEELAQTELLCANCKMIKED